jgi:hypothetical protein
MDSLFHRIRELREGLKRAPMDRRIGLDRRVKQVPVDVERRVSERRKVVGVYGSEAHEPGDSARASDEI